MDSCAIVARLNYYVEGCCYYGESQIPHCLTNKLYRLQDICVSIKYLLIMSKYYEYDETFFKTITSISEAYWLGFIAADGNISKNGDCLSIGLGRKDDGHLEKLCEVLNVGVNEKTPISTTTYSRLDIYNKVICQNLISNGVTSNKTLTIKPWTAPNIELQKAYWRGVFDGDGGFSKNHKIRKSGKIYESYSALLCGTLAMCEAFKEFVFQNSTDEYNNGTIMKHSSIYQIYYSGIRPAQTIAKLLYGEKQEPFLQRKQELAEEIINRQIEEKKILKYDANTLIKLYLKFAEWKKVAEYLDISISGFSKHRRRLGIPKKITMAQKEEWFKNGTYTIPQNASFAVE